MNVLFGQTFMAHATPTSLHDSGLSSLALTLIGQEVLSKFVALVLKHLAQVAGHLAGHPLHIGVQLGQVITKTHQLVQSANLKHGTATHSLHCTSVTNLHVDSRYWRLTE